MRKQAILLSALLIAFALTAPVYAQYTDSISREFSVYADASTEDTTDSSSREFSVYVDASPAEATDSISREFSVYVDASPTEATDSISREFSVYVDASSTGITDAISREFSVYVDASPAEATDVISREFSVFVDASSTAITDAISREFSVYAGTLSLASISPNSAPESSVVHITDLVGTGFQIGATVSLTRPGHSDIVATSVDVVSTTNITCSFDLTGKALGQWSVVVTNPDAQSATLSNAFTITITLPITYNWTEYRGHWYALTTWGSWDDCETAAQAAGGHLATIDDAEENAWVAEFVKDSYTRHMQGDPGNNIVWIGYDSGVWASGEPVSYTNLVQGYSTGRVFMLGANYAAWYLPPGMWSSENYGLHNGAYGYNPQGVIERGLVPEPPTPSDKLFADGSDIILQNVVVVGDFSDSFYVEKDNRAWGIRVQGYSEALELGKRVTIRGTLRTTPDGERYIAAGRVGPLSSPVEMLSPLGMSNTILGGGNIAYDSATGAGQIGVTGGSGLNNIGLLVKTTGRMTYVDANTFTIDDGSGVSVTCVTESTLPVNPEWQHVAVTGISSIRKTGDTYIRLLRVISVDSVTTVGYPPNLGEMIYVPAGSFDMGTPDSYTESHDSNEHPQHPVYLSAYYIGKYEVTRGEYRAFMNAGGYSTRFYWSTAGWNWKVSNSRTEPAYWDASQNWGDPPGTFTQTDNHPVVGVSDYEAQAFCKWAGGHLPTEAQWEQAARWNPTTSHANVYPWGDDWDQLKSKNWFAVLFPGWQTAPVGSYSSYPSASGCQDMSGNVWEWCNDWYDENYYSQSPASDPQGPSSGTHRVLRGGGWLDSGSNFGRCAYRNSNYPDFSYYNIGFRLAR